MDENENYWYINKNMFQSSLLHCFGNTNDFIDLDTAVNIIKNSETDFLTVYTHGNIDNIKSSDELPIGYSGLLYGDIRPFLNEKKYTILINTNHSLTVEDAIHRSEVAKKYIDSSWIKLEVLNKQLTKPINKEVIKAAKILIDKGFVVLPIINADINDAKKLENIGCSAIRVLMSDIGSEGGFTNKEIFFEICSTLKVPIIAEGGLRGPEDAYNAVVAGASAVLVNKALFSYKDPTFFIEALKEALKCGKTTYMCNKTRKY